MSIFRRPRRRPADTTAAEPDPPREPGDEPAPPAAPEQPGLSLFRRPRRRPAGTTAAEPDAPRAPGDAATPPAPPEAPADELTEEQAAAEAALARLEDRIGAFTSYTLAADFLELREIYAGTFERMKEEDWARRSERRAEGWTRRQALAHVGAVATVYNQAIEAGLEGRPVSVPGLERRADLKAANLAALDERAELPVADLVDAFLGSLEHAARLAASLEGEGLGRLVNVPFFDTPPTVAELFGSSLAHAGIVHGAQLALGRARPIWIFYQPGMMRRQLTRFMHMFGLAYWPERGGDLHATVGFSIEGQGGGSWFVRVGPGGGMGKIGIARTTDVSFWFASADLFCKVFTYQTPVWRAIALRQLRVGGNLRLARRLPALFSPT